MYARTRVYGKGRSCAYVHTHTHTHKHRVVGLNTYKNMFSHISSDHLPGHTPNRLHHITIKCHKPGTRLRENSMFTVHAVVLLV